MYHQLRMKQNADHIGDEINKKSAQGRQRS
jgi:hypothetical protein